MPGPNGDFDSRKPGLHLTWPKAIYTLIAIIAISSVLTFGATHWVYQARFGSLAVFEELQDEPAFDKLLEVLRLVHTRYVDPEDADLETLLEGAIRGAVSSVDDRYSMYYDARQYASMRRHMEGEYSGIGTTVTSIDGYVTIMSTFRGAPAATTRFEGAEPGDRRGLQPGDRIKEVEGDNIVGMPLEQAVELILGEEGTEVTLTVLREDHEEPLIFRITRARIQIPVTEAEVLPDDIGYLQILQFNENTMPQVERDLEKLKEAGIQALILDLRDNGGGLLSSVTEVSGLLVPAGPITSIHDRDGEREVLRSKGPGLDLPMVVLVNGGTASASEILAGAIRDYEVAPLVGDSTFGKGTAQNVWDLGDDTGLKVTTSRYLTPEGYSIDEEGGLVPDYEVELGTDDEPGYLETDTQLQEAHRLILDMLGR